MIEYIDHVQQAASSVGTAETKYLDFDADTETDSLQKLFDDSLSKNITASSSSLSILLDGIDAKTGTLNVTSEYEKAYSQLISDMPWAYDFYTTAFKLKTSKELLPYYKELNKLLHFNQINELNDFLYYSNPKYMSDVLLNGILRLTYNKRDSIKNWYKLKLSVSNELKRRGYTPETILRGLD